MIVGTSLVGLGRHDVLIAPSAILVTCDERLYVRGTVNFHQAGGAAAGRSQARRVLAWPGAPGVGARADLVGVVDVCWCGWHVGIALLEPVGGGDILCGLGLHHVGKAR